LGLFLLVGPSSVPIDDVDQLPGILAELKLKLALFVDDQLGSRVKHSAALLLILIVQIKFPSGQIEGFALSVVIGFTESDPAVGSEPDLAAGWRGNQGNVVEVIAKRAGDGNAANGLHALEGFDQTLVLALLERIDEDLPLRFRRVSVDGYLDADTFTQLGACTHCGGVDGFSRLVIGRNGGHGRCKEQREQQADVSEFPGSKTLDPAVYHRFYPFERNRI